MAVLENLEPKKVFHFFEELCQIPHGTFDTKRISDYCVKFAEDRGLEVIQDEANNVIIKKGGTEGYENSEPVILQGHLDMVCEKTPDSAHDFKNDPLELYVEDGYVKAKDTTLGGDDGIAIAMAMAVLDSDDIAHPPIEVVFTTDEETGMGGATAIDLSVLKGRKLLNIDSEVEGILTAGCAGGIALTTEIPVSREEKSGSLVTLAISGLQGGHSGIEIHKQRGNAHKMMSRLLNMIGEETEISLIDIQGGSKDNVIPMNNTAKILVAESDAQKVVKIAEEMKAIWDHEFMGDEPTLCVEANVKADVCEKVFDKDSTDRIINYLMLSPCGVQGYSRKLQGLVESSLNVGIVETEEACVKVYHMIRSSVESQKKYIYVQLKQLAEMVGAKATVTSQYPAWQYDPNSELRQVMMSTYKELFGKEPEVFSVHCGLECGLFLGKRPDLDCVSIGPNLLDVHSFNEKVDIASVERTWAYVKAILAALK
ncbi:MAG: aminoacyl-histidine dipeptidase [Lachnospiraceae bacterium]